MKNLSYKAFLRFYIPVFIILSMLFLIVASTLNYKENKTLVTNALNVAQNQDDILKSIKNQIKFIVQYNDDSTIEELHLLLTKYNNQLQSLKNGGYVEYPLDRVLIVMPKDKDMAHNIQLLINVWTEFDIYVRSLAFAIPQNEKDKKQAIAIVEEKYNNIIDFNKSLTGKYIVLRDSYVSTYSIQLSSFTIILLLVLAFLVYNIYYHLIIPVSATRTAMRFLNNGDISTYTHPYKSNDIFGKTAKDYNDTITYLRQVSTALLKIGEGDFTIPFTKKGVNDIMGISVEKMRSKLLIYFESNQQKAKISNWSNIGLANFSDIIRKNNTSLEDLLDDSTSFITKYVDAKHGCVFLLENDEHNEKQLRLISTYAWDKRRYTTKTLKLNQGLLGQSVLGKETIEIVNAPDDYIEITTGIGKANPNTSVIVPIIYNEEVYGVIELARFDKFEKHEIQFLEKIAETLGASISNVRINGRNQKLFEDSQSMTEQLRAQEEELRQNMEELEATQEEMTRVGEQFSSLVVNMPCLIYKCAYDAEFTMEYMSPRVKDITGYEADDFISNRNLTFISIMHPDDLSKIDEEINNAISENRAFQISYRLLHKEGHSIDVEERGSVIRNENGEVSHLQGMIFSKV